MISVGDDDLNPSFSDNDLDEDIIFSSTAIAGPKGEDYFIESLPSETSIAMNASKMNPLVRLSSKIIMLMSNKKIFMSAMML